MCANEACIFRIAHEINLMFQKNSLIQCFVLWLQTDEIKNLSIQILDKIGF